MIRTDDTVQTAEFYIEPRWLEAVSGGVLYYPASGNDLDEPIRCFFEWADQMHFCDIAYNNLTELKPLVCGPADWIG